MTTVSNIGARVDLQIRQGADFISTLTFTTATGTPVDLTGCALAAQIRSSATAAVLLATFTVTIEAPPTAGIATLQLPNAQSAAIPTVPNWADESACCWWDLELTDAAGNISSPLYGKVNVMPEITQ